MIKVGNKETILRAMSNSTADVLDYILDAADESGTWFAIKDRNHAIMERFNISRPTFYRILKDLVDNKILIKPSKRAIYKVNTEMVKYLKR